MSSSTRTSVTELPGFGVPVNTMPAETYSINYNPSKEKENRICFPNAITSWAGDNITIREKNMLSMMNEITDKPGWEAKVFDQEIVGKWKTEALSQEDVDFSETMFDYCIKELRDETTRFSKTGRVIILDSDTCVVKSDVAIPTSVMEELKAAVKPLEDVPSELKDWHPGSDEKVLDLVHPSLYPLIYGKSRVLPSGFTTLEACLQSCGQGIVIPKPDRQQLNLGSHGSHLYNGTRRGSRWLHGGGDTALDYWSDSYQWLPCEVSFTANDEVSIASYINNLHPDRHRPLCAVLEKCIARTIPLWNDCLSFFTDTQVPRRSRLRIQMKGIEYEYPLGRDRPLTEEEVAEEDDEDFDEDARDEKNQEWLEANRILNRPEPQEFKPIDPNTFTRVDLRRDWEKEGLQVIVKLANIELTPEKPNYEGGTWHIEGQLNEHICASAIYYYDQDNITTTRLAFRQLTGHEDLETLMYEQDDHAGFEELFGVKQHGPCIQVLGSVVTREGRLVAFPNVLQHQVQPFELADPSKPGYRKILALFLVDPYIRTLSTANVPPQQRDWWPADKVTEDWPITPVEAKRVREDLMSKRSAFVDKVNMDYEQEGFSFCEH
ncbi:hypothetical protein V5O48_007369 [Marasmius crinis-equi]|uniref:Duf1665 domain containing protein n=1 Tax=Marasmius crinis-equi TaxID=585013 RepID=A0ABR3FGU9_9AGAR